MRTKSRRTVSESGGDIVRCWVTEYQRQPKDDNFARLLLRIDGLIIHTVWRCQSIYPWLDCEENQDLYQAGVVGMHRGIVTARKCESGEQILGRILAYIRNEIKKTYPRRAVWNTEPIRREYARRMEIEQSQIADDVWRTSDYPVLIEKLERLVKNHVVSRADLRLFAERFVNGKKYRELSQQFHQNISTLQKRLERIRRELRAALGNDENW